ncbi:MAG: hypothetical protein KGO96_08360 [Elusimicrobia bacterium]|nr:hypothetical protein [Elusimicrobiota bacterium]MDE2237862.1 hypothetical protein [Elusimicrobiota bacterium]MDE2425901.1 hypothetical protein [Elusimicrobiota bacterium]
MKRTLLALLLAGPIGLARAENSPPKVAIVIDKLDGAGRPLIDRLSQRLGSEALVSVRELSAIDVADPIKKGRLVAFLDDRDLVVPVGDEATRFVSKEVEDARVFFVGAGIVQGDWLSSKLTAGIFSYNVDQLLDAVQDMPRRTLGFAYTPGYEPVARWIRRGASRRGIELREMRITSLKELAPDIRKLLDSAQIVWVVGDPMLVRGAGFEFLMQQTLSRRLPVIATGARDIKRGAFMSFEPTMAPLAVLASRDISSLLAGKGAPKIEPAPEGVVLVNRTLSGKWGIPAPASVSYRLVP